MSETHWQVVVVGAGAAGLMAGIRAAERGARVLVLEKNRKAGVKILMSGGTRCNITHATDNRGIVEAFGPPGRFLHSALAALSVEATVDFFEGEGGDPHTFFGTAHEWQGGTQLWVSDPSDFPVGSNTDFSQWHTYGALWVPGELSWFLDGRLIGSTNLPPIFDQQDFFLVLSMKEGARWQAGNLHGVSAQSLNLYVDYARVWQR